MEPTELGDDCAEEMLESRAKNNERLHDTTHNYIRQTASAICMASDNTLVRLDWTPSQPSGKTDEKWTSESGARTGDSSEKGIGVARSECKTLFDRDRKDRMAQVESRNILWIAYGLYM